MFSTDIFEDLLQSRRVRILNTGDPQGIRRISPRRQSLGQQVVSGLSWIARKLAGFVGFAFKTILGAIPWTVTDIFQMVVQAYFVVKNFDWNQTDEAIRQRIQANNEAMKNALAPLLGTTLGFSLVRLANFSIGKLAKASPAGQKTQGIDIPVLSGRIGLALAEEGGEEIRGAFTGFLTTVRQAQLENMILGFVLSARNVKLFGWEPINDARPNGSFAAKIEQKIESLPTNWQAFAENFLESFEESIIQAGYVVSFTIDDYVMAQKAAGRKNGRVRQIELVFDETEDTTRQGVL